MNIKQIAVEAAKRAALKSEGEAKNEVELPAQSDLKIGDYVLATKYTDGDPRDHWVIGFYSGIAAPHYVPPRHHVVDADGNKFRGNGFRRVQKISLARGEWMLERASEISEGTRSVWWWGRAAMTPVD